ncbi:programmed cell death 1 ligand 1 [Ascaphus truei]|uniref:programmed cell death 1 ligand 1 n=1 Tax=Ascaphus truei TaxID=8439 RepID=UPI003F597775
MPSLLFLLIIGSVFHTILALFIVTAPKLTYTAQYRDTVHMECVFPVEEDFKIDDLKVSWEHKTASSPTMREVFMFNNGNIDLSNQDSNYRGRATMLKDALYQGRAVLQITDLKLTDAGMYYCVLQLKGSDYKVIHLEVQASYENIHKYTERSPVGNEVSLTCQSKGFPMAEVYWQNDGINISEPANTSHTLTPDGFYKTTSTIKYTLNSKQNYNCVFWNKARNERMSATFGALEHIESSMPKEPVIITCVIVLIATVMIVVVCLKKKYSFKCCRKKGDRNLPI